MRDIRIHWMNWNKWMSQRFPSPTLQLAGHPSVTGRIQKQPRLMWRMDNQAAAKNLSIYCQHHTALTDQLPPRKSAAPLCADAGKRVHIHACVPVTPTLNTTMQFPMAGYSCRSFLTFLLRTLPWKRWVLFPRENSTENKRERVIEWSATKTVQDLGSPVRSLWQHIWCKFNQNLSASQTVVRSFAFSKAFSRRVQGSVRQQRWSIL